MTTTKADKMELLEQLLTSKQFEINQAQRELILAALTMWFHPANGLSRFLANCISQVTKLNNWLIVRKNFDEPFSIAPEGRVIKGLYEKLKAGKGQTISAKELMFLVPLLGGVADSLETVNKLVGERVDHRQLKDLYDRLESRLCQWAETVNLDECYK